LSATIVTRAPTRIDFGGGWTDVPPYSDEMGGFVCNVAITRYATVTVKRGAAHDSRASDLSSDRGVDRSIAVAAARRFKMEDVPIRLDSDFPIGAGLGGSSAAGVAAVAALARARGDEMTLESIAELSRSIEIGDLGIPGGRQDHYAAAFGGALGLRFSAGKTEVTRIPLDAGFRDEIERRCFIIYTGKSRISGETINGVLGGYAAREPRVLRALQRMRETAEEMQRALEGRDLDALGALVEEQWRHQRSLHPAIPTPLIDEIIERAARAGAVGSKALGASGGGCVLVIAGGEHIATVRDAISGLGEVLSFSIDERGVQECR
jgi:D-glycero-alpha-D-manno-heptose-7-phosphate kinase